MPEKISVALIGLVGGIVTTVIAYFLGPHRRFREERFLAVCGALSKLHEKRIEACQEIFEEVGVICDPIDGSGKQKEFSLDELKEFDRKVSTEYNQFGAVLTSGSRFWIVVLREVVGEIIRKNCANPNFTTVWDSPEMRKIWLTKTA